MAHNTVDDGVRVYLVRQAREALTRLSPPRRDALRDGLLRVGRRLLERADRAHVEPEWTRRTWPRRRYPQQCYHKTVKYVVDHPGIDGLQLVHGVVSHPPHYLPFEHAWVELPGDIVFDGVVQTFFTRSSYYTVMRAVALDAYSGPQVQRLLETYGHPGPWSLTWVPTSGQLLAYARYARTPSTVRRRSAVGSAATLTPGENPLSLAKLAGERSTGAFVLSRFAGFRGLGE